MVEFTMPSLGADMESAKLVEWLIKPGDAVTRGQVVAVVETQKGAIDVEVWQDGVVERLLAEPGADLPVGAPLAMLRGEGDADAAPGATVGPPAAHEAADADRPASAPAPSSEPQPPKAAASPPAARARVSPAARKRAAQLGVNLAAVEPAEAGGVVTLQDVEQALARAGTARAGAGTKEATPPEPAAVAVREDWRAPMRRAIAAAMSRSKREIPHYYLGTDIDITRMLAWLTEENDRRPVQQRLLPVIPLMKAVALALREVPELNGTWQDGAHRPAAAVHLGMAIAMRGGGLVAPAIADAHVKGLDDLMSDLRDLIGRVRGGRLRSSELSDPTVTLTNLGDLGVERVYGVIYPPQVAIIGLGKPADRPWIVDGSVAVRKVISVSLAADHRASDGQRGAAFLVELDRLLQAPQRLGAAR